MEGRELAGREEEVGERDEGGLARRVEAVEGGGRRVDVDVVGSRAGRDGGGIKEDVDVGVEEDVGRASGFRRAVGEGRGGGGIWGFEVGGCGGRMGAEVLGEEGIGGRSLRLMRSLPAGF